MQSTTLIPSEAEDGDDVGVDLASVFAQLHETSKSMPPPKLVIIKQRSLAQETFTTTSGQKNVHVVVKNSSFVVTVGLTGSILDGRTVDFGTLTIETQLLYDCDEDNDGDGDDDDGDGGEAKVMVMREVPYVKQRPVECKGKVNDKADQMSLEVKISVLSSHYENMCFRLRFQAVEARTGEPLPDLVVLSAPIKVISKPDRITKKRTPPAARKRKRTPSDAILESLGRIEEQQMEYRKLLLDMRREARSEPQLAPTAAPSRERSPAPLPGPSNLFENLPDLRVEALDAPVQRPTISTPPLNLPLATNLQHQGGLSPFELAFNALTDAFAQLPPAARPEKIRKILSATSASKIEVFAEMTASFNAQGLQKQMSQPDRSIGESSPNWSDGTGHVTTASLLCTCPPQQRLAEIDSYYVALLNN